MTLDRFGTPENVLPLWQCEPLLTNPGCVHWPHWNYKLHECVSTTSYIQRSPHILFETMSKESGFPVSEIPGRGLLPAVPGTGAAVERHAAVGNQVLAVLAAHRPLQLDGHQRRAHRPETVEGSSSESWPKLALKISVMPLWCLPCVCVWSRGGPHLILDFDQEAQPSLDFNFSLNVSLLEAAPHHIFRGLCVNSFLHSCCSQKDMYIWCYGPWWIKGKVRKIRSTVLGT